MFDFCITHILNTGCAKIWKKSPSPKGSVRNGCAVLNCVRSLTFSQSVKEPWHNANFWGTVFYLSRNVRLQMADLQQQRRYFQNGVRHYVMSVDVVSFIAVTKILLYDFHKTLQSSTAQCEALLYQVLPISQPRSKHQRFRDGLPPNQSPMRWWFWITWRDSRPRRAFVENCLPVREI